MMDDYRWLNEPGTWSRAENGLRLATDNATDFWQSTFYGFQRDSGHAYLQPVSGDFSFSATVVGAYEHLYDQAGIMLRIDGQTWLKTGIEYTDGIMHFSVVLTSGKSDWSVIPLPDATPSDALRVRLTRHGDAVRVQYAVGEQHWRMARVAPFPTVDAQVGIMACSPERAGFEAEFRDLALGPPIARKLHDD